MTYWITVYNPRPVAAPHFDEAAFLEAITRADFSTLCEQYGLEGALIAPGLEHLRLVREPHAAESFFLLRYGPEKHRPIVVERWETAGDDGKAILAEALDRAPGAAVRSRLENTVEILALALGASQVEDLGLVLAYEIARWAAGQGGGVIEGLDGGWYHLNRHQAFLPFHQTRPD